MQFTISFSKQLTISILLVFGVLFPNFYLGQKSEITIYKKNGYKTQKGFLVDGYKQGKWVNINTKGDTSFSHYEKDVLVKEEKYKKWKHGINKGKTIYQEINHKKLNGGINLFFFKTLENEVYELYIKNTIYSRSPYFYYQLNGNARLKKSIRTVFDFRKMLHETNKYVNVKYDRNLVVDFPYFYSVDFQDVLGEYGDESRTFKNISIQYKGKKYVFKENERTILVGNDSYSLRFSETAFFYGKFIVEMAKNGQTLWKYEFYDGIPTYYASFYPNRNLETECFFRYGMPYGNMRTFYENGQIEINVTFDKGIVQDKIEYYNEKGNLKLEVPYKKGKIDGLVSGNNKEIIYKESRILGMKFRDSNNNIIKWTSGSNLSEKVHNTPNIKSRIDKVNYLYNPETKEYSSFGYSAGKENFRYTFYPTQDMILVNVNKDKDNWFSVYLQKNGEFKDDINVTYKGENFRKKKTKRKKLKLIHKKFYPIKDVEFGKLLNVRIVKKGNQEIKTTYHPSGNKVLEEIYENGKLNGKRKLWGLNGKLLQEIGFVNNLNHGIYMEFYPDGNLFEKGEYNYGQKIGKWIKIENKKRIEYEYDRFNYSLTNSVFSLSGQLISSYAKTDSTSYNIQYNNDGTVKSEYYRNKRGKIHGKYFGTYGNKNTVSGKYLNGYRHGEFNYYDSTGKLMDTKQFDFGKLINFPKKRNSVCVCKKEFNSRRGSSFFNSLNTILDYKEFIQLFNENLGVTKKEYKKYFVKGFISNHSSYNTTLNYSFGLINFSPENGFNLAKYKGIKLEITPCLNPGEIGDRRASINIEKPASRYQVDFEDDKGNIVVTSENLFELMSEMNKLDFWTWIEKANLNEDELVELLEYFNKKGYKIPITDDFEMQFEAMKKYMEEEFEKNDDIEEKLYELIFKKHFNHGVLNRDKNPKGYAKFNKSIHTYFSNLLRITNIENLEKHIIFPSGDLTIDGGRFALKHDLIEFKNKPTSIFFNTKNLEIGEQVIFNKITDICIESNSKIKGTELVIKEIIAVSFTNKQYKKNIPKLILKFSGKIKNIRNSINFDIEFTKDNIKGIVYTNTCDLSEIKTIVEKLNGEYVKSRGGVVFELKH